MLAIYINENVFYSLGTNANSNTSLPVRLIFHSAKPTLRYNGDDAGDALLTRV
jgi:hypothetical protein